MINVGAYVKNSSPKIDRAIAKYGGIQQFLNQEFDLFQRELKLLKNLMVLK